MDHRTSLKRDPDGGAGPWSLLASLLPVGILETDMGGECLALNPAGAEILGLEPERALGMGWLDSVDPLEREAVLEHWSRAAADRESFSTTFHVLSASGSERTVSCRVVPVSDRQGRPAGHLATLLDITYWERTEQTLRETTQELEARVRELDCLFGISRAVERNAGDLPAILMDTVDILADTLGHPGKAAVRIVLGDQACHTPGYTPREGDLRSRILVHGQEGGRIEVRHPAETDEGSGPLTPPEEQRLLAAVAQRLGRTARQHPPGLGRRRHPMRAARDRVNLQCLGRLQSSHRHTRHESLIPAGDAAAQRDANARRAVGDIIHQAAFQKQVGRRAMDQRCPAFGDLPTPLLIEKHAVPPQRSRSQQPHFREHVHIIKSIGMRGPGGTHSRGRLGHVRLDMAIEHLGQGRRSAHHFLGAAHWRPWTERVTKAAVFRIVPLSGQHPRLIQGAIGLPAQREW